MPAARDAAHAYDHIPTTERPTFHEIRALGAWLYERFGHFAGENNFTTKESERLARLPLFYNMSDVNQRTVINTILSFFG